MHHKCPYKREAEAETETERETERNREREGDRQKYRQRDRETEADKKKETQKDRDRETERERKTDEVEAAWHGNTSSHRKEAEMVGGMHLGSQNAGPRGRGDKAVPPLAPQEGMALPTAWASAAVLRTTQLQGMPFCCFP